MTTTDIVFDPDPDAPCRDDPKRFSDDIDWARGACEVCPSHDACQIWAREHALDREEIYAGETGRQRRKAMGVTKNHWREVIAADSIPPDLDPQRSHGGCKHGHPASAYKRYPGGHTRCAVCNREAARRSYQRRKQEKAA